MNIDRIAWATPPGSSATNRPRSLTTELVRLGRVQLDFGTYFHGRARSVGRDVNAGIVMPRVRRGSGEPERVGVMSPVFVRGSVGAPAWSDFYDDWSLAPDINVANRATSALTYRQVRARRDAFGMVTCNSKYMQAKLDLPDTALVPNGVERSFADLQRRGDGRRRLVVLGKFFVGRTDFSLILNVARAGSFDEIVVGAPGDSRQLREVLDKIAKEKLALVRSFPWLRPDDLANIAGPRTVALIPHLVTDYTLSQDLMKVYQFAALGIPVISPRLLWPDHVSKEYALLLDFGVDLAAILPDWTDNVSITDEARQAFVLEHSWEARARAIDALMVSHAA